MWRIGVKDFYISNISNNYTVFIDFNLSNLCFSVSVNVPSGAWKRENISHCILYSTWIEYTYVMSLYLHVMSCLDIFRISGSNYSSCCIILFLDFSILIVFSLQMHAQNSFQRFTKVFKEMIGFPYSSTWNYARSFVNLVIVNLCTPSS